MTPLPGRSPGPVRIIYDNSNQQARCGVTHTQTAHAYSSMPCCNTRGPLMSCVRSTRARAPTRRARHSRPLVALAAPPSSRIANLPSSRCQELNPRIQSPASSEITAASCTVARPIIPRFLWRLRRLPASFRPPPSPRVPLLGKGFPVHSAGLPHVHPLQTFRPLGPGLAFLPRLQYPLQVYLAFLSLKCL